MATCVLCSGACDGANLTPLITPDLQWLWDAIATAADRRGDPAMTDGPAVTARAPADPQQRAAGAGIIKANVSPGQRIRIQLPPLTALLVLRGPRLTPGAVAAHATGRPLAQRAIYQRARGDRAGGLRAALCTACDAKPDLHGRGPGLFEHLRRAGWVARLDGHPDAIGLIIQAVEVTSTVLGLPQGRRYDRRLLCPSDPHALDDGTPLSGVVLAMLTATGTVSGDQRITSRSAWAQAGIDCDEIMGGLTVLGIYPAGWTLPSGALCTLPPRELHVLRWPPPPEADMWVFVTENPSVIAAAAAHTTSKSEQSTPIRLVCTMGNPSATEISAVAALADAGWNLAIRADFDATGIRNVTAILKAAPDARPWRMTTSDYFDCSPAAPAKEAVPPAPWDPDLAQVINGSGRIAFEEALMDKLLDDLACGRPR